MFSIEMLPAQQGDALWIEYGSEAKPHRILVDGGTPPTVEQVRSRVLALPKDQRRFELLIVTHIDTDHIGGILRLLSDKTLGLHFDDVWFNAWPQIQGIGTGHTLGAKPEPKVDQILGPKDGEILDKLLNLHKGTLNDGWNHAFGTAKDARVAIPDTGDLPVVTLKGGMRLTVLGPSLGRLKKLRDEWEKVIRDTKLTDAEREAIVKKNAARKGIDLTLGPTIDVKAKAASKFESDDTPANGSSIIVLAEFEKKSALLTGDAYADGIAKGVTRLQAMRGKAGQKLKVDVVKVAHHGSKNNTSLPELGSLDCKRFLISSNGNIFHHPDVEAICRILVANGPGVDLGFAYDCPTTKDWRDPHLQKDKKTGYTTRYPAKAGEGLRTVL